MNNPYVIRHWACDPRYLAVYDSRTEDDPPIPLVSKAKAVVFGNDIRALGLACAKRKALYLWYIKKDPLRARRYASSHMSRYFKWRASQISNEVTR